MSRMNSSQEFWIIILQLGFIWGRGIWISGYGRVLGTMLVSCEFMTQLVNCCINYLCISM